jgi:hypothetical protein
MKNKSKKVSKNILLLTRSGAIHGWYMTSTIIYIGMQMCTAVSF